MADGGCAYFVPYLSAVRLFAGGRAAGGGGRSESAGAEALYEFSETQPPQLRPPLSERAEKLAGSPAGALEEGSGGDCAGYESSGGGHGSAPRAAISAAPGAADACARDEAPGAHAAGDHALLETRLSDVHRESWYAVAWYPIYRIPERPLRACFLTYHQFMLLPGEGGGWELPTVGAVAANTASEPGWFAGGGVNTAEEMARVRELAAAADAIARQGPAGWRHADFEFLCSRGTAAHQLPVGGKEAVKASGAASGSRKAAGGSTRRENARQQLSTSSFCRQATM